MDLPDNNPMGEIDLVVASNAFSHASRSAESQKLSTKDEICTGCCARCSASGSTHARIDTDCAKNLYCQTSLVVIVVFISSVNRVPSAKNMMSSNLEASTPPKVGLGHLRCSTDASFDDKMIANILGRQLM
ncbi:PLAC8 family protein [Prunus dulcis]|uniref:PLAC8 family protein n=1 Tax=Prunus dulcis TaxID=3755 RepID=A0A4Y1QKX1_PRUDU|nr:PLAC8 family protein [Prunus dulcis]